MGFEDGEEAESRHALFEPDEGFFLDNGKDCGMIFGTQQPAATSCKAALAAQDDADKDRWRAPGPGEEGGGKWLVGKRVRVFWSFDSKFHEAIVEAYDPDPKALDSRSNIGPVHRVRYDESRQRGVFPENFAKCVWNLDKKNAVEVVVKAICVPSSSSSKKPGSSALLHTNLAPHGHASAHEAVPGSTCGVNGADSQRAPKAKGVASGAAASPSAGTADGQAPGGHVSRMNEDDCLWTAPHWKFKTGGKWLVGRRIKLYWDAERHWFAGLSSSPHSYLLLCNVVTCPVSACLLVQVQAWIRLLHLTGLFGFGVIRKGAVI